LGLARGWDGGVYEGRFWLMKLDWKHCADAILVGDSRVGSGLSPAIMAEHLMDRKIFNFAFDGCGFYKEYLNAMPDVLDPESHKKMIVMGITPRSLINSIRNDHFIYGHQKRKGHSSTIMAYTNDLLQFCRPMQLKELVSVLLQIESTKHFFRKDHTDGWSARQVTGQETEMSIHPEYVKNQVSAEIIDGVLDHVRAWTESGIAVYAFRPPTTVETFEVENQHSGFDEASFVKSFEDAGGIWIDVDQTAYPSYDGSHLCPDGAIAFSHDLSQKIAASEAKRSSVFAERKGASAFKP
ncbi:MAG: hypothetical protein JXM79_21925, partial [Sedimentisphaerales bacterium]|nr:hypothetical protein [Sedimentisphaerales bacterium]